MRHRYSIHRGVERIKTKSRIAVSILGIGVIGLGAAAGLFPALAGAAQSTVVYNNIPSPQPGNVASLGYEATQTKEFGSQVDLDGNQRTNPKITVLMSSWACKSGTWNAGNCITNPGSTFTHPVTVNVYNVGAGDTVGSLIKSDTESFSMPYRPTADDGTFCNAGNGFAGEWYDGTECDNGKAFTISFNLNGVTLPDHVIVGVAYNTSDYGVAPLGDATACHSTPQGCPYDSLNFGLNAEPTVGSSLPSDDNAYWNTSTPSNYSDGGAGGVGTFRLDTNWTGYLPSFEIAASATPGSHQSGNHHDDQHHNKNHGSKNHNNHGFYSFWNH